MSYLGQPDIDAIFSALSETSTAHFINNGHAETCLDINGDESRIIRSRQQIIDYFRHLHFHKLTRTTIDNLPNNTGAIVHVQSRKSHLS